MLIEAYAELIIIVNIFFNRLVGNNVKHNFKHKMWDD